MHTLRQHEYQQKRHIKGQKQYKHTANTHTHTSDSSLHHYLAGTPVNNSPCLLWGCSTCPSTPGDSLCPCKEGTTVPQWGQNLVKGSEGRGVEHWGHLDRQTETDRQIVWTLKNHIFPMLYMFVYLEVVASVLSILLSDCLILTRHDTFQGVNVFVSVAEYSFVILVTNNCSPAARGCRGRTAEMELWDLYVCICPHTFGWADLTELCWSCTGS